MHGEEGPMSVYKYSQCTTIVGLLEPHPVAVVVVVALVAVPTQTHRKLARERSMYDYALAYCYLHMA